MYAQSVNLVPNGGFEDRIECIYNNGNIEDAPPWFNPMDTNAFELATPDLFHICAVINEDPCPYPENANLNSWIYGVPTNFLGCEAPYEGNGYAGGFFYWPGVFPVYEYREYLAVKLIEPLVAEAMYEVSMQISLAERMTHALWNVQVLLSSDSLYQETQGYMDYIPQLNGTPGDYIDNKDGWRQLSWTYTAAGGEEFMYIGNFQSNTETDALEVVDTNSDWHYPNSAYYFVDDVRVIQTSTSTSDYRTKGFSIYPNPVSDQLSISIADCANCTLYILDIQGRKINSRELSTGLNSFDFSSLSSGMYFVQIANNSNIEFIQKIVKQ